MALSVKTGSMLVSLFLLCVVSGGGGPAVGENWVNACEFVPGQKWTGLSKSVMCHSLSVFLEYLTNIT